MSSYVDETNDPGLRSWVEAANDGATDFPIQNLPFCVFRRGGDGPARVGVGIGDLILDLHECVRLVAAKEVDHPILTDLSPPAACALMAPHLNDLMRHGQETWREVRRAAQRVLSTDDTVVRTNQSLRKKVMLQQNEAQLILPAAIGDYTDFYCSIHHATNVGSMFRPDNPLLPNYKHLPIGYHGRASSIVVSGTPVRRPMGQTKADDADAPGFGPCKLLDYELELGFFVGPGNAIGERITMAGAAANTFGMCIVNDWSARDVQKWEYQPLGPFNAKNFATTISPWVVTLDGLAPYRIPGPPRGEEDPPMLDYLNPVDDLGLDITVEVWLASETMRASGSPSLQGRGSGGGSRATITPSTPLQASGAGHPPPNPLPQREGEMLISRGTFADMYWTIGQMLVHHTSTGCNLRPGDLIASGTVSNQAENSRGCLLERTWRGTNPIDLPDGSQRRFLQDGDEVIIRAYCQREGAARIGFGECRGVILPAE